MSEAQKIDIQLDIALTVRLVLALMGFMVFSQQVMIVPGFFALFAVACVLFHMLVGLHVEHKHIYLAAMCTWGSAVISTASHGQGMTLISLFTCLYLYELFTLKKWGWIHA
jgi:hypothetical protein